MEIKDILR